MTTKNKARRSAARLHAQRGNVFLFVIMGIALFAALSFVISRGMRSETATGISRRDAELAAADILAYAQQLERGVTRLRQRGISENDIDFSNATDTDYAHSPAQPPEHNMFTREGAALSVKPPLDGVNDGTPWLFTGRTCVPNIGTGGANCASNTDSDEELMTVLPNINRAVCEEINKRLKIAAMPSGGGFSNTKFTGTYADGAATPTDGLNAACFQTGTTYHFYYVLLAR